MNALVQACFDDVDAALTTLLESITSYNPSPNAAISLVEADDSLARVLSLLAEHQQQFLLLQQLRAAQYEIAAHVKADLRLLADTRRDLLQSGPTELDTSNSASISSETLLSFAQRIAKHTRPQTRGDDDILPSMRPAATEISETDGRPQGLVNGSDAREDIDMGRDRDSRHNATTSKASEALSEQQKAYLSPDSEATFVPWPAQDVIRLGALQKIQEAVDAGRDMTSINLLNPADPSVKSEEVAAKSEPHIQANEHSRGTIPVLAAKTQTALQEDDFDEFDLYDPTQG